MPHGHSLSQIKRSLEASKQLFRCISNQNLQLDNVSRSCRSLTTVSVVSLQIPLTKLHATPCKHNNRFQFACSIQMALSRHQTYLFKALSSPKLARRHRYSNTTCDVQVKLAIAIQG